MSPSRANRMCSHPGCRVVVSSGRCSKHQARYEASERLRKQEYETRRPASGERGYDADWRAVRRQYLAAHPKCCVSGCGQDATDVDHIKSVREAPELRLSWSNLRSMCHSHHSQRTGSEQGGGWARRGPRT